MRPNPNIEATENAPMYSSLYIAVKYLIDQLNSYDCRRFISYVECLYDPLVSLWRTTPNSAKYEMSLDNFTGIWCGLKIIKKAINDEELIKRIDKIESKLPLFHKQLDHPRDFIFIGYLKYPYLFYILLFIPIITMFITCYQMKKIRPTLYFRIKYYLKKGKKFPLTRVMIRTDGKLLGLLRFTAVNNVIFRLTQRLCNSILKYRFKNTQALGIHVEANHWNKIFRIYFKHSEHPLNVLVQKYGIK